MISFTLPGTPIPQRRPRFTGKHVYDPNAEIKHKMKWELRDQMAENDLKMLPIGPIAVKMTFHMPIRKSASKSLKNRLIGKPHINTPDADNLFKAVADAMTGVVYVDDRYISEFSVKKIYSDVPRTEIEIWMLQAVTP